MGPLGGSLLRKYWTILRVGLVVVRIRLALRVQTLPQVLEQVGPLSMHAEPDEAGMKILTSYVERWLQLFPYNTKGNCFPRAVALYRFARERGYPVRLHCGVRREAAGLAGHAWLTLDSEPFYEPGTHWRYFTVTFSYPPDLTNLVRQDAAIQPHSFQVMEP
jgi:hypothetical protein